MGINAHVAGPHIVDMKGKNLIPAIGESRSRGLGLLKDKDADSLLWTPPFFPLALIHADELIEHGRTGETAADNGQRSCFFHL